MPAIPKSVRFIGPDDRYTITGFPLKGAVVTPSDTDPLDFPGTVRVNADGQITVVPAGNAVADTITLDLLAGEFVPCLVSHVMDTGTDAIVIHVFY